MLRPCVASKGRTAQHEYPACKPGCVDYKKDNNGVTHGPYDRAGEVYRVAGKCYIGGNCSHARIQLSCDYHATLFATSPVCIPALLTSRGCLLSGLDCLTSAEYLKLLTVIPCPGSQGS